MAVANTVELFSNQESTPVRMLMARHLTFAGDSIADTVNGTRYLGTIFSAIARHALTYDLNGNLTSDGVNTYTWNARDQLVSISGPALATAFQYDATGRRVSKTVNSITTSFVYDGLNIVQEKAGPAVSADLLTAGIDQVFSRSDPSGVIDTQ